MPGAQLAGAADKQCRDKSATRGGGEKQEPPALVQMRSELKDHRGRLILPHVVIVTSNDFEAIITGRQAAVMSLAPVACVDPIAITAHQPILELSEGGVGQAERGKIKTHLAAARRKLAKIGEKVLLFVDDDAFHHNVRR